jgi:hypothetical protein
MKMYWLALVAFLPHLNVVADIIATGTQAVPPNSSTMQGSIGGGFAEDGRFGLIFSVSGAEDFDRVTSVDLFRSTSPTELGLHLYSFSLGRLFIGHDGHPDIQQWDLFFDPTSAERADLEEGLWWINASTVDIPTGEVRAQIILVPEPSVIALIGLGGAVLLTLMRRRR